MRIHARCASMMLQDENSNDHNNYYYSIYYYFSSLSIAPSQIFLLPLVHYFTIIIIIIVYYIAITHISHTYTHNYVSSLSLFLSAGKYKTNIDIAVVVVSVWVSMTVWMD